MQLTLPNELELRVQSIDFSYTYEGLLVGAPNFARNHGRVNDILDQARKMFTHLPVFLLSPRLTDPDRLPSTCWIVRLSGPPRKADADRAGLVVVWFTDYDDTRPLRGQMEEAFRDLSWDPLAKDWRF
jgi:hypothetical protein